MIPTWLMYVLIAMLLHVLAVLGIINYKYRQRNGSGLQTMTTFIVIAFGFDVFSLVFLLR